MNKKSIAFQLAIYILTAVVVVISLIVFLNYKHSKKILMEKIEEGAIHQSSQIIYEISRNVINTQEIVRNVSYQATYYESHGDLPFFLHQVTQANKVVTSLHVQLFNHSDTLTYSSFRNSDGEVIDKTDLKHCSIFKFPQLVHEVLQKGTGIWSKPFYCPRDSTSLIISYFLPIKNKEGEAVGVATSDINLQFLQHVTSNIHIGINGFAFVISDEGYYLTHPRRDWIMKRNIFDVSSRIFEGNRDYYRDIIIQGQTGSGFAYPELLNYEKSWFYFAPIPYTNWRVVIVIPTNELFNDLDVISKEIIIVSVIGILVVLFIIIIIFNRMFSPLMQIIKSIQRFSFGDRGRKNRKKKNEIELLSDSLKELQFQYGTYIKEQNQVRKDKRKYEKDLKSAKEIQRTIIPQDYTILEKRKEIDLFAILQPAESIGGDLYDFFFIDTNHILFTMGDVSGKGIPAALFMAVANTMIKSKSTDLSAMHIVDVVNKALSKENSNQHFLTLFLGILDIETGILDYCNAAHNYPFLIRKNKDVIQLEQTHGLPIGLYSNKTYKSNSIVLSKNDQLFLYTDGVLDCKNNYGEFFGNERLTNFLQTADDLPPRLLVDEFMKKLMHFKGETKQADDISLMAIKFNGKYT